MIILKNISKHYHSMGPIHHMTFTFKSGEKYIITGASGIGKTTLLKVIMGLESLDEGTIVIDEKIVSNGEIHMDPRHRQVGYVYQEATLWSHMSVRDNIAFGLGKRDKDRKVQAICDKLGLTSLLDRYPKDISGGEAKRVSLARTMVLKWRYLLLDEPLSNVDDEMKDQILSFINDYVKKNKTTLIYVTHDEAVAEKIKGVKVAFSSLQVGDLND